MGLGEDEDDQWADETSKPPTPRGLVGLEHIWCNSSPTPGIKTATVVASGTGGGRSMQEFGNHLATLVESTGTAVDAQEEKTSAWETARATAMVQVNAASTAAGAVATATDSQGLLITQMRQ